jgi:carboxymethylenebutenolidase
MPENQESIVEEEVLYGDWYAWFLAYPENNKEAPWVVIIHEWWGLNEHIEDMARLLAMQWYKALAVDLYGGVVPDGFEEARLLSSSLDQDAATANLMAAERYLRESSSKVASLWRCLWGKQSLQLSLASDTLDGTVIYYGRLTDDVAILQNINEPVLWIFAENDQGIPPSAVTAFQSWLDAAWVVDYDITIYPWVDHAFANPTGTNHAEDATLDARSKTMDFLDKVLMDEVAKKKNNF